MQQIASSTLDPAHIFVHCYAHKIKCKYTRTIVSCSIQGPLPVYKDKTAAKTEVAGLCVSLSKWGLYIFCTTPV